MEMEMGMNKELMIDMFGDISSSLNHLQSTD
jgi:hypothetical protein